jgi:LPS O-antigen subunit length determinant protein (WzzB/FepE family)
MDQKIKLEPIETKSENLDVLYYRDTAVDEINLGELFCNLIKEWKTFALVMAIGIAASLAMAYLLSRVYLVEATLRIPSVNELGALKEQSILEITPAQSLQRVVDQLLAPNVQKEALERSSWLKTHSENSESTLNEMAANIRKILSLDVLRHDYYELNKDEKPPFKEISLSLPTSESELAAEYLGILIEHAQQNALASLTNDIQKVRDNRIQSIEEKLKTLSQAAKQIREAEISRLQEANQESILKLQQQIDLTVNKVRQDRENRIIQLTEALNTAESLGIKDPVTWDDLRPERRSSQITNELGDSDFAVPLYFRGIRLLNAELNLLSQRENDKPFIGDLTSLEKEIIQLRNDPRIATLKARVTDTIFVEQYADLQRKLTDLLAQPTRFENTMMAVVTQPALIPPSPMRNPLLIVLVGVILSGFLALFIALIRMSIRNSESRQTSKLLADQ